jgi:type VI secretion system secreted protein VgrG
MEISTPLGNDLLFHRMSGREDLSQLFEYQVDLLSARSDVSLDEIMGKNVTVKLELPDNSTRFYNGYVTRFTQKGTLGRYYTYQAVVSPWLWFLTRTSDCRIFSKMTVPKIVEKVLNEHSVVDVKFDLSGTYREWEYCVQYRETDFNFVARLMEQEGIYFFFKHQDKRHTLVVADSYTAHETTAGYESIPFIPSGRTTRPKQEYVDTWSLEREIMPGRYVMDDFNFETPSVELQAKTQITRKHAHADYEMYDYPGEYELAAQGEHYVRRRLEQVQTQFELFHAQGNPRGLAVGSLFKLTGHTRQDQNREYLVVGAGYKLEYSEYESLEGGGSQYSCGFTAMSSSEPFRPPRSTPKPIVHGPQTAIVVGPAGEEIYTDKYGRVKVQFHWDREGKHDENSSCWMRVSHPWAGKGWGAISVPRIGQEVIVDFLEGDPDSPIITGRVYNAETMPPFGMPAGAVVSGIKTNTHKGSGYNEMSMDDTAGKEKITIHGQYDMNTTIEHDQTNTIHNDQTNTINNNQTSTVKNDKTTTVNNKFTETIKSDATIKILEGKFSHDVAANTADYHVQGALTEKYDATQTTTVKDAIKVSSTAGPISVSSDAQHIEITAATKITLKVGASSITMDSSGKISVEGLDVTVKGATIVTVKGGIVHSEADSQHQTKGAIVLSDGSATNTVKGGMVMLNP